MDDIYRENILDHYRHPRNFGKLENPDIDEKRGNPFCGDEISVTVKFSLDRKKVEKINFQGVGCAVSMASASLLTEYITGKSVREIMSLKKEKVIELLGIELSPTRLKCALLALETIQFALNSPKNK